MAWWLFLTACNRHRLSIYNEAVACLFRLNLMIKYGQSVALRVWQQMIFLHAPSPLESKVKVVRDQEFRCSREVMRLRRCVSAQA